MTPMQPPAPSGRWTALHFAARNGCFRAGAELLVGGADPRIMDDRGYRRAAHKPRRRAAHADRCRQTPRQLAQQWNKLGEYDAAVAQARPPHRPRRTARAPPAWAPLAAASIITHAIGRGGAGRTAPCGEGRGASRSVRMLVRVLDTYVVAEVLIVHMRALGSLRSERIAGGGCRQRQWRVEISIYFRGCGGRTLRVPCCIARKMRRMLHVASYMARGGILSTTQ